MDTIQEITRLATMLPGLIAPRPFFGFASASFRLCLGFVSALPQLRLGFASATSWLCLSYVLAIPRLRLTYASTARPTKLNLYEIKIYTFELQQFLIRCIFFLLIEKQYH